MRKYSDRFYPIVISLSVILFVFTSCGVSRYATLPQIPNQPLVRNFERPGKSEVDSLKALYGNNKKFADEFIEPALIALSYFPELKDVNIEFKYSKESTTMAARPVPLSLFSKRKYIILINNKKDFEGILLEDVPFNAQVGIIGHELSHIADYKNYNFWGILGAYFRYSGNNHKPLFEKEIDRATIKRGLGWQLYDWATYSLKPDNGTSEDYREFKRNTYMKPDEIRQVISFLSKYGSIEEMK